MQLGSNSRTKTMHELDTLISAQQNNFQKIRHSKKRDITMFGKKTTKASETKNKRFVIVRSFYGMAEHIALNDGKNLPLCGYENGIPTDSTRDKIEIIDSIPNQHKGWFWCGDCAEKATGFDADTIRSYKN